MTADGVKTRLAPGACSQLNIVGGLIYYVGKGVISCYDPATGLIDSSFLNASLLCSADGQFYFANREGICVITDWTHDEKSAKKLTDDNAWQALTVMGDYVYYRRLASSTVASVNIKTGKVRDYGLNAAYPHAESGVVYANYGGSLFRIDPESGEYTTEDIPDLGHPQVLSGGMTVITQTDNTKSINEYPIKSLSNARRSWKVLGESGHFITGTLNYLSSGDAAYAYYGYNDADLDADYGFDNEIGVYYLARTDLLDGSTELLSDPSIYISGHTP
jgi:hypothetical protein